MRGLLDWPTGLAIALLVVGCASDGVRLSVDLRTDYAPGVEFDRVEVDIGGESETALVGERQDFLHGERVADLRLAKGLQEGTVRLYTPLGVLLAERGVSIMIDARFGTTITVDRSCEDVACPMGDLRAVSCLGGRCVDPLCVTGEEDTCPDPQCASDVDCPSPGCGVGRCAGGTCLLEGGACDDGFYCAGSECRVRPMVTDAGVVDGATTDAGSGLCGTPCLLTDQPCARAELACDDDGSVTCRAIGPADSTTVCRPSAGECDVQELCDGTNLDCPPDLRRTSTCRPSRGDCDPAEVCDGTSAVCPPDELAAGSVCRGSTGECDRAEVCTGDSVDCPLDEFQDFGTLCSDGSCDGLGACTSCVEGAPCSTGEICERGVQSCSDMTCVGAGPIMADIVCRAAIGPCDRTETCGSETTCPDDDFEPAGVACRLSTGVCDPAEVCTGTTAACPPDLMASDGDICSMGSGCGPLAQCMAGSCIGVDEPSCAVSLAFDGVDDLAVLPYASTDQTTFELFFSTPATGAIVSIPGAWSLEVRPAGGLTHELFFESASCASTAVGAFEGRSWVHLAIWIDGGTGRATALIDGAVMGSVPVSGSPPAGELYLGSNQVCGDAAITLAGGIANVRVWSRLVPEGELRINAMGNDPAVSAGLAHWYRIDENSGQRLFDDIGGLFGVRGRDGTPESTDPRWVPGP